MDLKIGGSMYENRLAIMYVDNNEICTFQSDTGELADQNANVVSFILKPAISHLVSFLGIFNKFPPFDFNTAISFIFILNC